MSDPATVAREYLDAWNRRDWTRFRAMMHADYSYTGADGKATVGADAGIAVAQMFANAFPDGRIEVERAYAAGDVAVIEFTGHGTHRGQFMGIAPTNRRMTLPVCNVLEVRDGKIRSEREYMDMLFLVQQLGAAPVAARM